MNCKIDCWKFGHISVSSGAVRVQMLPPAVEILEHCSVVSTPLWILILGFLFSLAISSFLFLGVFDQHLHQFFTHLRYILCCKFLRKRTNKSKCLIQYPSQIKIRIPGARRISLLAVELEGTYHNLSKSNSLLFPCQKLPSRASQTIQLSSVSSKSNSAVSTSFPVSSNVKSSPKAPPIFENIVNGWIFYFDPRSDHWCISTTPLQSKCNLALAVMTKQGYSPLEQMYEHSQISPFFLHRTLLARARVPCVWLVRSRMFLWFDLSTCHYSRILWNAPGKSVKKSPSLRPHQTF